MKKVFFFLVLFILKHQLFGQGGIPPNLKSGERSWERITFAPLLNPYFPLALNFTDRNGSSITIDQDFGFRPGLRFERYAPNSPRGFSLEADFQLRELIFEKEGQFFFSDRSIGLTPILSWKTNNIEHINHPFIEVGIHQRFSVKNGLVFSNEVNRIEIERDLSVRKLRSWAYLGLGIKRNLFNQDWSRIQLSSLRLGAFFPLFDQANIFKNRDWSFSQNQEKMELSYFSAIIPNISYLKMINFHRNTLTRSIPNKFAPKSKESLFSPLPNWNKVQRSFSGNFYSHFILQPEVDSVSIINDADEYIINLISSWGWRIGYTIQFLGNHKRFYNEKSDVAFTQLYKSAFRWNLFGSAGIFSSHLRSDDDLFSRYSLNALEVNGGIRLGIKSLFMHAGYCKLFNVQKEVIIGNKKISDFSYGGRIDDSWLLGFSLSNNLCFRIYYQDTFSKRSDGRKFSDNLFFSLGFGL